MKFEVKGVDILLRDLDKYSQDAQKLVAEEVKDWSDRVEAKAKQDVPVDTGALKASIRAVGNPNRLSWAVKVGGINGVNYAPYVVFGTGSFVDQAFLQEFGLVQYASRFKGASQDRVHLPMRDFLYRNARTEFQKTFNTIKRILQAEQK